MRYEMAKIIRLLLSLTLHLSHQANVFVKFSLELDNKC